jgi:hypothetical protein
MVLSEKGFTMRKECIETVSGKARLQLTNRNAEVDCVLRIFQEFSGSVPTLRSASGGVKLPHGDVAFAMLEGKPLGLSLKDGRKATILFTELDGAFVVTGPIA